MFGLSIGNGWSSHRNYLVSLLLIGTSRWDTMTRALCKYCHPSIIQVRSLGTLHTQLWTLHSCAHCLRIMGESDPESHTANSS